MEIKTTGKAIESLGKEYTRVAFDETGCERFVVEGDTTTLYLHTEKRASLTHRSFRILVRDIIQNAKKHKLSKIAVSFDYQAYTGLHTYGETWFWQTIAENMQLAFYEFTRYKSKPKKVTLTEILLTNITEKETIAVLRRGEVVASYVNKTRDIANTPGGDMTPDLLGKAARAMLKDTNVQVKVLDEKQIAKLKMGGLLGVSQGAHHKPRFIVLEYKASSKVKSGKSKVKDDAPIVFVGKGVTFDTGGLQVKPGMSMYEMHLDMSGGAAVIGALGAVAKLGLPGHFVGLIPATENAISDTATRPGDVLHMMSGATVDVLHTDAEGRLILADALHYAKQWKPRLVIDVATLTGAALVAVGQHAHVIMTKDRALEDTLRTLGEESGDYVHPLPLWEEYKQYTKGVHGDISNIPQGDSKYGGSINGGTFLSHFTKDLRWAHIDMAPRMTTVQSDKLAKGATGEPVRLLVKIAEKL